MGRKSFINKKGLFYAKFFEFEEFSIEPFFCSSIQPQHTVYSNFLNKTFIYVVGHRELEQMKPILNCQVRAEGLEMVILVHTQY
jgi:hypothetical protein